LLRGALLLLQAVWCFWHNQCLLLLLVGGLCSKLLC
jgi:hypothetical protein